MAEVNIFSFFFKNLFIFILLLFFKQCSEKTLFKKINLFLETEEGREKRGSQTLMFLSNIDVPEIDQSVASRTP